MSSFDKKNFKFGFPKQIMLELQLMHLMLAVFHILLINIILILSYFIGNEIKEYGAAPHCIIISNILLFFGGVSLFAFAERFLKISFFAFLIDLALIISAIAWYHFHKSAVDVLYIKKPLSPDLIVFYLSSAALYLIYYFILSFLPQVFVPFPISLLALCVLFILFGAVLIRTNPILSKTFFSQTAMLGGFGYLSAFVCATSALYYAPGLSLLLMFSILFGILGMACLWFVYPQLLVPKETFFIPQDWALLHCATQYLQNKKKHLALLRKIKEDTSRYYGKTTPIASKDYLMLEDAIVKEGKYGRIELR
ncbi:MAG: hypothetical protein DRO04_00215, partial [Candidatus Iainarchaeum archaeon]